MREYTERRTLRPIYSVNFTKAFIDEFKKNNEHYNPNPRNEFEETDLFVFVYLGYYLTEHSNIQLHSFLTTKNEPIVLQTFNEDDRLIHRGGVDCRDHHHKKCNELFIFLPQEFWRDRN